MILRAKKTGSTCTVSSLPEAYAVLLDGDTVHASVALAVSCSVSGLPEEYTSTARQWIQCFNQFAALDLGF